MRPKTAFSGANRRFGSGGSDGQLVEEVRALRVAVERQADAIAIVVRDEMMKVA